MKVSQEKAKRIFNTNHIGYTLNKWCLTTMCPCAHASMQMEDPKPDHDMRPRFKKIEKVGLNWLVVFPRLRA